MLFWPRALLALLFIVCITRVFFNAWVTEDAYITFRVIDNYVHGYGLRWNIDERVQVYTHPLWMLLHILPYAIFGNIYWLTIAISLICTALGVYWLVASRPISFAPVFVLVFGPILLSRTFADFAASGLETPLLFALLGWFFYLLKNRTDHIYWPLFVASLCFLTRMDSILLIAPALLWLLWKHNKALRVLPLMYAVSPAIAWCSFSLFYYGFVFPNTKYAKLNTGIETVDYIRQGYVYLKEFVLYDPLGFVWITLALAIVLSLLIKAISERRFIQGDSLLIILAGAGISLQLAYVTAVGGDFMSGRFYAPSFYLAVWLVYQKFNGLGRISCSYVAIALAVLFWLEQDVLHMKPINFANLADNTGVVDERKYYAETNTLIYSDLEGTHVRKEPTYTWVTIGVLMRNDLRTKDIVTIYSCVGMLGYYAGPERTLIDFLALTDPLLARLPIKNPKQWRIGHYERYIPPGYTEARRTGDTSKMPLYLREYYEKLRLVTSGDLWSADRLWAIVGFHTGRYEALRQQYIEAGMQKEPDDGLEKSISALHENRYDDWWKYQEQKIANREAEAKKAKKVKKAEKTKSKKKAK